ncbi:MAG: NAD(P)H-hydrate epimerase [Chloroflexi bacterium]|nr:NAD(P)H-hydrate epimerase [Chloroflexota bacterium]
MGRRGVGGLRSTDRPSPPRGRAASSSPSSPPAPASAWRDTTCRTQPWRGLAAGADVIVDALIGSSLEGAPDEAYQPLIGVSALTDGWVVSLDLPSGIDASSAERPGAAVRADVTLGLGLPKIGAGRGEGRRFAGQRLLADIGIPPAAYQRLGIEVGNVFRHASIVSLP